MTESLLPSNATAQERALDLATARIGDVGAPLRPLWDPVTCPESILPWLAWALSVDEWESSWPVDRKRTVIAASVEIHRRKGTVRAVKQAIAAAGFGDATLIERFGVKFYDGTRNHDGAVVHDVTDHWAEYRLTLPRPVSIAQAAQVRRIADSVAPLRCRLKVLDYQQATNLYDATILHDGTFAHGVA